jgi:putative CocE/NonD family hydrolase
MQRHLFLALVTSFGCALPATAQDGELSAFGVYEGFGEPTFDGYERESFYVAVRDGTELAVDLYRPTRGGAPAEEPLPLVWTHDRYHRAAQAGDSATPTKLFVYPFLRTLLNHGYLVAAVDARGAGASFGTWHGIFQEVEALDAYDVTEWFAEQEWCDGNIGMYGGSYLGGTQFMAASQEPPHLRALFPFVAPIDLYEIAWSGGIYRDDLCRIWGDLTHMLDRSMAVASVEFDDGFEMKKAALAEHEGNRPFEEVVRTLPHRDSVYRDRAHWPAQSPLSYTDEIEQSGVAIYHQGGWFDPFSRDAFLMYRNLDNPQKVVLGPWFHSQAHGLDWKAEGLRWYDHHLKGIENGVMDEEPIHYWTLGAPEGEEWRAAESWPLPEEERVAFFFHPGASGSIASVNDGVLSAERPTAAGADAYTVDYSTSSGAITRWSNAVGQGGFAPAYTDLAPNDARCLTYTTAVLEEDLEVTGHPIATLWWSQEVPDSDVFLYLEEVHPDGRSQYVTEGCLRVSQRGLAEPDHERFGLPYHPCLESTVTPADAQPMQLVFDLFPVSNVFDAGHRVRVTIAGADDENALTPPHDPPPTVEVLRGGEHASFVELPVIPRER